MHKFLVDLQWVKPRVTKSFLTLQKRQPDSVINLTDGIKNPFLSRVPWSPQRPEGKPLVDHKRAARMLPGESIQELIYTSINTCHSFVLTGTAENRPWQRVQGLKAKKNPKTVPFFLLLMYFTLLSYPLSWKNYQQSIESL